jgi:hypothetical protein
MRKCFALRERDREGWGMGGGGRFHPHTSALDFDFELGLVCSGILDLEPVVMYCYPLRNCAHTVGSKLE